MHTIHLNNKRTKGSKGFTAVELLITLFVAVAFLMAGYMLYGVILNRSTLARAEAQADNLAFSYLRQYEASVATTCIASTPLNNAAVTGDSANNLGTPTVTVQITCPISSVNRVSKIQVTIAYLNGGRSYNVQHEIYASQK